MVNILHISNILERYLNCRDRETQTPREREILHLLVHFTNEHSSQRWARQKPGPGNSVQVSYGSGIP